MSARGLKARSAATPQVAEDVPSTSGKERDTPEWTGELSVPCSVLLEDRLRRLLLRTGMVSLASLYLKYRPFHVTLQAETTFY